MSKIEQEIECIKGAIQLLIEIRNALAHYRPIALKDYEKFCRAVEQAIMAGLIKAL